MLPLRRYTLRLRRLRPVPGSSAWRFPTRSFARDNEAYDSDSDFSNEPEDVDDRLVQRDPASSMALMSKNMARYERAVECLQKAEDHMRTDNYEESINQYTECIGLFSTYLEFKYGDADPSMVEKERATLLLSPLISLAFAQQCSGKTREAEHCYQEVFEVLKSTTPEPEVAARVYINYAELLCSEEKPLAAISMAEKGIKLIKNHKSELYASVVSNLSIYFTILRRHEEALPYAKEGYELFTLSLGKNNAYAELAMKGYCKVLEDNEKHEEAKKIREQWEKERKAAKLPSSEEIESEVASKLGDSLTKQFGDHVPHFDLKNDKSITPEQFAKMEEKPKAKGFAQQESREGDFSDPEFLASIEPELKAMYSMLGKADEFDKDMSRFKKDPAYAEYRLGNGIGTNVLTLPMADFYGKEDSK